MIRIPRCLPTLKEKLSGFNPLVIDLIEKMLVFDPDQRISVD